MTDSPRGPRQSGLVKGGPARSPDMPLQCRVWWGRPEELSHKGSTTKDRAVAPGPSCCPRARSGAPLASQALLFRRLSPAVSWFPACPLGFRPGDVAHVPPPSRPARCPGRKEPYCVSSDRAFGRLRSASWQPPLCSRSIPAHRLSLQPSPGPRRRPDRRRGGHRRGEIPSRRAAGAGAPKALATSTAPASSCAPSLTRASSTRSVAGTPGRATPCSPYFRRTRAHRAGPVAPVTLSSGAADPMPGSISATASRSAR